MKVRLISSDGKTALSLSGENVIVIDGEDFGYVNRTCNFLFSSKINFDEKKAKDRLFMFVPSDKLAFVFVLNKAVYKDCLQLVESEFTRDDCLIYYEDIIVFKYSSVFGSSF